MTSAVCEHCQGAMTPDDGMEIRHGGFSYHMRCHKCYVCSETSLHKAEVFRGVIFCNSCAKRIFQGCSDARRSRNSGRAKRSRSRSHREGDRKSLRRRHVDRSKHGVIELAEMGAVTDSGSSSAQIKRKTNYHESSRSELRGNNGKVIRSPMKSIEVGVATDGAQELLEQIDNHMRGVTKSRPKEIARLTSVQNRSAPYSHIPRTRTTALSATLPQTRPRSPFQTPSATVPRSRRESPKRRDITKFYDHDVIDLKLPLCSDLRIAELGASTEMANMALRKKSEIPVIIKSDGQLKTSGSLSMVDQCTDESSEDEDYLDPAYSTDSESSRAVQWLDRRLGSLLRLPFRYFRNHVLRRSSRISTLVGSNSEKRCKYTKQWKDVFRAEVTEHQGRGIKKLYSTINRKKTPFKLGWLQSSTRVSRRCKHFRASHSYRCMRSQVMRLAGPTKSKLACIRRRLLYTISPLVLMRLISKGKPMITEFTQSQDRRSVGQSSIK